MGCLAVEGTYDRMFALLDGARRRSQRPRVLPRGHADAPRAANIPAIDIILLFAAAEGDLPKLEEARLRGASAVRGVRRPCADARPSLPQILAAGADASVKDLAGNTPMVRLRRAPAPRECNSCTGTDVASAALPPDAGGQGQPRQEGGDGGAAGQVREVKGAAVSACDDQSASGSCRAASRRVVRARSQRYLGRPCECTRADSGAGALATEPQNWPSCLVLAFAFSRRAFRAAPPAWRAWRRPGPPRCSCAWLRTSLMTPYPCDSLSGGRLASPPRPRWQTFWRAT